MKNAHRADGPFLKKSGTILGGWNSGESDEKDRGTRHRGVGAGLFFPIPRGISSGRTACSARPALFIV
jgi:hypothetical protein